MFITLMYPTQPYNHMQKSVQSSDASSLIQLFYHCIVWRSSGALQNLQEVLVKEYKEAVKIQVFWMWCWTWTAWPWRWRHCDPSNHQDPLVQWHGIRSHKTRIFSNTAVTASNLQKAMLTSSLQQWDVLYLSGSPVLANRLIHVLWCYSEILFAVFWSVSAGIWEQH